MNITDQKLYISSDILINMEQIIQNPFARSPTLETILMVERTIESHSGEFNRTELWKNLPKKVMWQTYLVIIDYLEQNNKIIIDKDGKIVWIWNPSLIRKLEAEGLLSK
jgi:hypothetical protein